MWSPIYIGILCLVPIISGRASVTPEDPKDISPDPELLGSIPISVAAILGPCGNNRDPIPNLDSALRGYNVIQGNQFFPHGNDPGFKLKIFKGSYDPDAPDDPDASGDKCTYSNIQQFEATYCKKSGNSRSYRSYQDYQEAKTGSVANSVSVSASVSAGGLASFISSFEATSSFSSSKETEFSKEKKFFSEEKGEIYMNKARCEVYEVRISSLTKPKFTSDFISALKRVETAAKSPDSASSKEAMKEFFTEQFGTHYMSTVFMGASMTTENRYVGTTSSSEMRSMRKECSENSYSMSIGTGAEGVDVNTGFKAAAKKCKGDESNNAFFSENSYSEFNVVTRGSIPTEDNDEWRENIKESPIPIRFELKPISALFRADWLEEHGLDAALLQDYVTDSLRTYCEVVLGRACVPVKGCGVTGFCSDNEVCSSDFTNKTSGYRCDSCEYGWEFNPVNQKCYKYVSDLKTWADGRDYCSERAQNPFGDLATAPDKRTNDFLSSLNEKNAFIGGVRTKSGWTWNDGSKWGFTSWAKGEPSGPFPLESVVVTNFVWPTKGGIGKWNDFKSSSTFPFFCQYPLKGCYLEFKVRGKRDAHILFSPSCTSIGGGAEGVDVSITSCNAGYTVVIGGWSNTKSAIYDNADQEYTEIFQDTPGIMSEKEFRKFWIRMGEGNSNSISVGRGGEEEPFISQTFKKRHAVLSTAFSAYLDTTIDWKIKIKDEVKEISTTGTDLQYIPYHCYN